MSTSQDKAEPPPVEETQVLIENKENVPSAVDEPQQHRATIEETPVEDSEATSNQPEPNMTVAAQKDVRSDKSGPVRRSKRIASQNLKRELEKKNNAGELRGKSQSKTPKKKANIRTTTNALVTPTTRKYKTKGNVLPSYGPGSSKATASSSTARTKSFPPAVHSKRKLDEDYDQVDEDTAANRSIKRRSTNIKNTLAETANEKKVTDKKGSASSESSSKTNTTAKQTKATEKKPTTSTSTNRQRSTRSGKRY